MRQVLSSLDVLVHGHRLSGHTVYSTGPPGAKLSDVQFGRHVDLCQKKKRKEKSKRKKKKEKNMTETAKNQIFSTQEKRKKIE